MHFLLFSFSGQLSGNQILLELVVYHILFHTDFKYSCEPYSLFSCRLTMIKMLQVQLMSFL